MARLAGNGTKALAFIERLNALVLGVDGAGYPAGNVISGEGIFSTGVG